MTQEVEASTRRCVILALKSTSFINFEELLEMEAVRAL
jgi:hypothetical protein